MVKRHLLKDGNGNLWDFDSFVEVVDWMRRHCSDLPFEYWDLNVDKVVGGKTLAPSMSHNA